jgi:transmembrane sensor
MERDVKALGRTIATLQDEELAPIVERARERVFAPAPRRSRSPMIAAAAAALAVAALVFLLVRPASREPVTFDVARTRGVVGSWVRAPEAEQVPLRFSDGATLLLAQRAHGQVTAVNPDGARVMIAKGHATVSVPSAPGIRYRFDVGPFALTMNGTRFDTSWDPASEVFELDLHDGSVQVSGPTIEGERVVVAGQHVRIALAVSSKIVDEVVDSEPQGNVDAAAPSVVRPTPSPAPSAPSWRRLSEEGKYAEALAAAGPAFDALLTTSPSADVLALADTARLGGDRARAKRAYTTVRSRFSGSADAGLAAFWLGRGAVEDGDDSSAAQWFETYLRERPNDRLAREALGRLLEARDRQGDAVAAKALAVRYLEKYPDGPHAKLARKLKGE